MNHFLRALLAVWRRECVAALKNPAFLVFLAVFLISLGALTFEGGGFFDRGQADLTAFFVWHPLVQVLFLPALTMRMWADDARSGVNEFLLSLPAPLFAIVLGKWLAGLSLAALALALTCPIWITVNLLGAPDNGVIVLSYLMSLMMAGGFIAIGLVASALSQSQALAYIVAVTVSGLLTLVGLPLVSEGLSALGGPALGMAAGQLSVLTHFEPATIGLFELGAPLYFLSLTGLALALNALLVSRMGRS